MMPEDMLSDITDSRDEENKFDWVFKVMEKSGSFGHNFILSPEGEPVHSKYQAECKKDSHFLAFT